MPASRQPVHTVLVKDIPVPVHIFVERRTGSRISLGKEKINVRLSNTLSGKEKNETIRQFLLWAQKQIAQKKLYQQKEKLIYEEGDSIIIFGEQWILTFPENPGKRATIHFRHDQVIEIRLPVKTQSLEHRQELIQKLLAKGGQTYYLPKVQERVLELNKTTFNKPLHLIRLRYMISRWGSCSTTGNISLSSRLLLAPMWVFDYVVVHELAHRIEMNHSARFWRLVSQAMPEYKNAEKWLRKHGANCDY